jgi:hypothetical protein
MLYISQLDATVNLDKETFLKYPRYRPTWPRRVQEVKAPRFIDTRQIKVVRSSPLRTGRLYLLGISWYSLLEDESTPGTWTFRMVRKKKIPSDTPGTFRLVAQRLNHYATPGPDKERYEDQIQFFLPALASGNAREYCQISYAVRIYLPARITHTEIWKYCGDVDNGSW